MEQQTATPKTSTHKDVYQIVTERIIEQLEKGTVPWQKPWQEAGLPKNLISNRYYRGINCFLLASLGYTDNLFLTYKQLQGLGGKIKKDERAHLVTYWNFPEKGKPTDQAEEEAEPTMKKKAVLRYYMVYNIEQCENIPKQYIPRGRDFRTIPLCEDIVRDMPNCPPIKYKEQAAFYDPRLDYVNMPKHKTFKNDESYYATLFHELVHSTGHHSRLNRKDLIEMAEFGNEPYSHEELVAEMGTSYLQSIANITSEFEQSAAYIKGWLWKLKNDKRFIVSAASHAQKAVDYILNVKAEVEEKGEEE